MQVEQAECCDYTEKKVYGGWAHYSWLIWNACELVKFWVSHVAYQQENIEGNWSDRVVTLLDS